ncbi:uncharacterized protein LOC111782231 [Cucurbita pepo subsp. pepo]|uniref:uncharacterized protein LOC111782231 n=1 Tax=Cucurbita pepo subsp. pepo TaxID=3664 RepID=UPI000C9D42D1|nr:uncharacterized protein LOC111782231 [Cucurbita pepo subsp. pepo]
MDGGGGGGNRNDHTSLGGVRRRKPTKKTNQPNNKKKPIKVVYISNPMKVKTSASKFMALVQELTGQDADFPDPSKFHSSDVDAGATPDLLHSTAAAAAQDYDSLTMNNNIPTTLGVELPAEDYLLGSFYDDFDDLILPPPLIGNFSEFLPAAEAAAAAVMYESYAM